MYLFFLKYFYGMSWEFWLEIWLKWNPLSHSNSNPLCLMIDGLVLDQQKPEQMVSLWNLELLLWICKTGLTMVPYAHIVILKINSSTSSCWWWEAYGYVVGVLVFGRVTYILYPVGFPGVHSGIFEVFWSLVLWTTLRWRQKWDLKFLFFFKTISSCDSSFGTWDFFFPTTVQVKTKVK